MRGWLRRTRLAEWTTPLGLRRWHVGTLVALALVAAALDAVGLGLLVPIAQGLVSGDFSSARELPLIGAVAGWVLERTASPANAFAASLLALAGLTFLVTLCRSVVAYGSYLVGAHLYGAYEERAYVFALERYLQFGKQYFDQANRGATQAVLGFIGELIDSLKLIQLAIVDGLTLVGYLAVLLWISPTFTLVVLVALPAIHFFVRSVVRRIQGTSEMLNTASLRDHAMTQNILSSAALLKAFGAEDLLHERFARSRARLRRINFRINTLQGAITPAQEILGLVVLLGLLALAAVSIGGNAEELARFLVFFYIVRTALPRLTALQERITVLATRGPRLEELGHLLDDAGKYIVADGDRPFEGLRESITVRDLSFEYVPGIPVLENVGLRIERGTKTALVGPSGAGKSTLVELLLRLYEVPPGTILLDGVDIRDFRSESLRGRMAVVPQEVLLFNDSLRANLRIGSASASDAAMIEALRRAHLGDWFEAIPDGLDAVLGDDGVRLSGGQRQRVAICRAMLRDPEILILDEATSALDSDTERKVQASIEDLLQGRTSLVIAHRLSTVANADAVVVIDRGRVIQAGHPATLLDEPGYLRDAWRLEEDAPGRA